MAGMWLIIAMSFTKSKSVNITDPYIGTPHCGLVIDYLMMKSMAMKNRNGQMMQPSRTLVKMSNMSDCASLVRI